MQGGGLEARYTLGHGALVDIRNLARTDGDDRFYVITDEHVAPLWADAVAERLTAPRLALPPGEESKRWASVETAVRWLLEQGAERRDTVVAVGGGVITDVAGFVAAVTMRGMRWVAVPTTLLAMVDAAIGGKTGIDLAEGKNLVGTFWFPSAVVADPAVLATLDPRQLRAGLAEVVKAAMIAPATLQHHLPASLPRLAAGNLSECEEVLTAAAKVKVDVVARDERESGLRASLNLGHTLGHAMEAAAGYGRLLHGEAVAWGLVAALILSCERALLPLAEARRWAEWLELLRPLPNLGGLRWHDVAPFLARDKKRSRGSVGWILPRVGGVVVGLEIADEEARQAFERLKTVQDEPLPSLF
jgi:3-dehydroquinate synthase